MLQQPYFSEMCALTDTRALVHKRLRDTSDNLSDEDFKRFKCILRDDSGIPWNKLENADRDDTMDLIVQKYCEEECGEVHVMMGILRKMDQNQLAADLQRDLKKSNHLLLRPSSDL